jgi:biopolymer transport protein ExbB/TolQ
METLLTDSGRYLITQGVLGVIVLVLGIVNWLQYRENRTTNEKRFEELQRIIDARETVAKAMNANSLALEANNRSMDLRTRATEEMANEIADLKRVVETAMQQGAFADERVKERFDELLRRIDDYLRARGAA